MIITPHYRTNPSTILKELIEAECLKWCRGLFKTDGPWCVKESWQDDFISTEGN